LAEFKILTNFTKYSEHESDILHLSVSLCTNFCTITQRELKLESPGLLCMKQIRLSWGTWCGYDFESSWSTQGVKVPGLENDGHFLDAGQVGHLW